MLGIVFEVKANQSSLVLELLIFIIIPYFDEIHAFLYKCACAFRLFIYNIF